MKEVQLHPKDQVTIVKQQEQRKLQLSSQVLPGDGHRSYEFSLKTYELREIKPIHNVILSADGSKNEKRIDMKDGFIYITALNEKNAVKAAKKLGVPYIKVIK